MLALSDYLAGLVKEVSHARASADRASIQIASLYKDDNLLKYFSAPRFRIEEVKLDIPLAVAQIDFDENFQFDVSISEILKIVLAAFSETMSEYGHKPFVPESADIGELHDLQMAFAVFLKYKRGYNQEFTREQIEESLQETILKVAQDTIRRNIAEIQRDDIVKPLEEALRDNLQAQLIARAEQDYSSFKSQLETVQVNPETNLLKRFGEDDTLLRIEMKIIEEGVMLERVNNDDGTHFEVLSIE